MNNNLNISELIHLTKTGNIAIKLQENGKTVACGYLKATKKGYYLYRVYVKEELRERGLGTRLMNIIIEKYGDKNIHLSACPNRISDLELNRDYYKAKLFGFYARLGFVRKDNTNTMVRYAQ
ncbi:MAG: GNAT family N-acetyltransferase [Sphaerospermopsis sp.]|nr:GNAT family N-acetyltransferase [Sphaerospermopsis sp.]